jgi:internalin A
MKITLNNLLLQLIQHAPELAKSFRPPISEKVLIDLELSINQRLPDDLRQMYLMHDGCDFEWGSGAIGLFGRHQWWPVKDLRERWHETWQCFDQSDPYGSDETEWAKLPLRPWTSAPPSWIPIGVIPSYASCTISIDMLPGPGGTVGQIVAESIHAMSQGIFANSLTDYFTSLMEGLKTGSLKAVTDPDTKDQYWGYASRARFLAPGDRNVFG